MNTKTLNIILYTLKQYSICISQTSSKQLPELKKKKKMININKINELIF